MKRSLKNRILAYLIKWHNIDPDKWIPGYKIEELCRQNGYMASNGLRRCRELSNEGRIQRRLNKKFVEYRYEPFNY